MTEPRLRFWQDPLYVQYVPTEKIRCRFLDKNITKTEDNQRPRPNQIFVHEGHHYPLLDQVVCLSKGLYLKILNMNL